MEPPTPLEQLELKSKIYSSLLELSGQFGT